MTTLFIRLYDFFKGRLTLFWAVFSCCILLLGFTASRIQLEEDITKFFPDDERVQKLNYVFQNSKFVERIVVMVSVRDSASAPTPDSLVNFAEILSERMGQELKPFISRMVTKVDDDVVLRLFSSVYDNLPVFLDEHDYAQLDSMVQPGNAERILETNYRQLISPAGVVVKQIIAKDPLGFSFLALQKLKQLQYDDNFELYDGYILTKDRRHLIFFVSPVYSPNDTGHNSQFVDQLNELIENVSKNHSLIQTSYFGAPVVAVGNAKQLREDSILTVSLVVIFLAIFLTAFFARRESLPDFIPVVFGAIFL